LVVFEKSKTGYSVNYTDILGWVSTGRTKKEAEKNMYQAIKFHLKRSRIEGLRLPKRILEAKFYVFA